jgi:hypothetical protein
MNKQELSDKISESYIAIHDLENKIRDEKDKRIEKEYEPLIIQAEAVRRKITQELHDKYRDELSALKNVNSIWHHKQNQLNIAEAEQRWLPSGTIVDIYERSYRGTQPWKKTGIGMVQVYDGTQTTLHQPKYTRLNAGDIIVIKYRKDGTLGVMYDLVFKGGTFQGGMWLAEGETLEDNKLMNGRVLKKSY